MGKLRLREIKSFPDKHSPEWKIQAGLTSNQFDNSALCWASQATVIWSVREEIKCQWVKLCGFDRTWVGKYIYMEEVDKWVSFMT